MRTLIALATATLLTATPALAGTPAWIPTWYAAPEPPAQPVQATLSDQTVRQIVHIGVGGTAVRIRLSNAYGTGDLHFDTVTVAQRATGTAIRPGTSVRLTFGGRSDVTVAPGAYALSDPMPFAAAPQSDLAISTYVSGPVPLSAVHLTQRKVIAFAAGDVTASETLTEVARPVTGDQGLWLSEVEVSGTPARGLVVAFGDSITDGMGPAADTNAPWPDRLNARFATARIPLSVVNAGISGNRLLHNGSWAPFGQAGMARFDTDVLSQPNLRAVIVMISINDIGQYGAGSQDQATPEAIITGLTQLAARAHENGVRIYAGTLTPFKVTTIKDYYSEAKEAQRQAVNAWIRGDAVFDGVADFDKALDDPANPGHMRPEFDSGDHLHPSAAGDAAIADAVPLAWFK